MVKDRPIGIKQLLLGRTSTIQPDQTEAEMYKYMASDSYLQENTRLWWKLWIQEALPILLPFYRWEEAKGHMNLWIGDFCPAL